MKKVIMAISEADRHRPLIDGSVKIALDGQLEVDVQAVPVQNMFDRLLGRHEFDISEMPIASYIRMVAKSDKDSPPPYTAIPVFPSRFFRHSCVFVNRHANIQGPADLAGRRIGVAVFDMAAAVWMRGIFRDDYGLDPVAPVYVTGGMDAPRPGDAHPQFYPPKFTIQHIGENQCLADMLVTGEIEALYTASAPRTFFTHPNDVGRLFDDPVAVEKEYFARTKNFPIMHTTAIRTSLLQEHPDLAPALENAMLEAQAIARKSLLDSAALAVSLPWLVHHLEETEATLGTDFWKHGVEASRTGLDLLMDYLSDEGLIARRPSIEELFPTVSNS